MDILTLPAEEFIRRFLQHVHSRSFGRGGLLAKQRNDPPLNVKARVGVAQIAALVHQPHRRDAKNSISHSKLILPALAVEMLRPLETRQPGG